MSKGENELWCSGAEEDSRAIKQLNRVVPWLIFWATLKAKYRKFVDAYPYEGIVKFPVCMPTIYVKKESDYQRKEVLKAIVAQHQHKDRRVVIDQDLRTGAFGRIVVKVE